MKADLIIKNCRVVSPSQTILANIHIKNGKISAITDVDDFSQGEEVVDAGSLYALPGLVDPHVHMMDPGHTEREDFITGSRAAAYGGVTTVIDHHRTEPPVWSVKELTDKIEYLSNRSLVDFGLMGGGNPENVDKLEAMFNKGVTSFKIFTCDLHHQPAMGAFDLYLMFKETARLGALTLIHSEDNSLTVQGEEYLKSNNRFDYMSHYEWRSPLAEEIAVDTVLNVAMETGAKVAIAHSSSPRVLEKIKKVKDKGYSAFAESCAHYFYLSTEDLAVKGPWVKFAPAVRTPAEVKEMWNKLNSGMVSYLGSDHCPFPQEEKQKGVDNIWEAPNGIPGVETGLRLMLNGVNKGLTTINKVVEMMCKNPAVIYGLYPQKGTISVGADADIVLVDMEKEETLENSKIVSKCGWTPFDGKKVQGAPKYVYLRGNLLVKDNEILGQPGMGQFVSRIS